MMNIVPDETHTRSRHYWQQDVVYHLFVCGSWICKQIISFPSLLILITIFSIELFLIPCSLRSLAAALQSSIRAEWSGTYRSCALPHSRTCLNLCKLLFWLSLYINVPRTSDGESFIASCSRDSDFFHFCMNHIPE